MSETIRVPEEDLPTLAFLPIWIFHSMTYAAFEPSRIGKMAMIKALEAHSKEDALGIEGFLMGYLKTNLHHLYSYHYNTTDAPDFTKVDQALSQALDLLRIRLIEQSGYEPYVFFLKRYVRSIATNPCITTALDESEEIKLGIKAKQILKLLS